MSKPILNVGVVGASGVVGEIFLRLMEQRKFPAGSLLAFASPQSSGKEVQFQNKKIALQPLSKEAFRGLDIVFFSAGDEISREWAPVAVDAGAWAIDNSAAFRMEKNILLCVPEINGNELKKSSSPQLIANPNCSTIQLVMALHPLLRDFGIESVTVSTYQSVSGAGKPGLQELEAQIKDEKMRPQTFAQPIAFNCVPQIGGFNDNGFCTEEIKIIHETKKILGANPRVSATTVRVPARNAHSEAVWVRLSRQVQRNEVLTSLRSQAGLSVNDSLSSGDFPTALSVSGQDAVYLGRLRQDLDDPMTWLFWVVGDNLRKGAALNGLQIAERIFDIN